MTYGSMLPFYLHYTAQNSEKDQMLDGALALKYSDSNYHFNIQSLNKTVLEPLYAYITHLSMFDVGIW